MVRAYAMLTVEAAIFEPRLGHIETVRPRPVLLERVAPTKLPYNAHALRQTHCDHIGSRWVGGRRVNRTSGGMTVWNNITRYSLRSATFLSCDSAPALAHAFAHLTRASCRVCVTGVCCTAHRDYGTT